MVRVSLVVTKRYKKTLFSSTPVMLLGSLAIGLIVSYLIIWAIIGLDPVSFFGTFYNTLISYTGLLEPLLFLTILGAAIAVAFYGSFWNVGAEGQYVLGMLGAMYTVMYSPLGRSLLGDSAIGTPGVKLAAVLLGGAFGAVWSALPGLFKAFAGVNEVPVLLLMNYIAYNLSDYLTAGPWKGKYTYGYIRTDMIPEPFRLTEVPGLEILRYEVVIAAVVVLVACYLTLERTRIGLKIKVLGTNPTALRSSGYDERGTIVLVSTISGFIAGLAGALRLLGYDYRLPYNIGDGKTGFYGYTAILVAWLSFRDLRLVVPSATIVSILSSFGYRMQIGLKGLLPPGISAYAFSQVFIGVTLVVYTIARVAREFSIKLVVEK